jgi:hypothetical protein
LDGTSPDLGFSVIYTEESPPVAISRSPGITDVDNTNIQGLVATIVGASGPQEVLSLNQSLTTPLTFSYTYPQLRVTGMASLSTYEAVVASMQYQNLDDEIANTAARSVNVVITDSAGGNSIPVSTIINIAPVDDNPPMFVPSNVYSFTVQENSPPMTLVGVVSITDPDLPPAQDPPIFSIASANPPEGFSDFFISTNASQGQIFVNGPIDFDGRIQRYSLVVTVQSAARNATATVSIDVTNLADIPPVFPAAQCPLVFSTVENELFSTPLSPQSCTAIDPDNLDSLRYEISGNNQLITIHPTTGILTVVDNIDRETVGVEFAVTITAIDSTQATSRNITVEVQGVNEHPPQFTPPVNIVSVDENVIPSDDPILLVRATDADEVPDLMSNNEFVTRISYSIDTATVLPYFAINDTTGQITQLQVINFEMFQVFQFTVSASDNDFSPTPMQTTTQVIINVVNINDEPPQFVNLTERIVVNENAVVLEQFATIIASDEDINADLRFSILPPAPPQFFLTSVSGVLSATQPLDAEVAPREFDITLQVEDLNTDPRYSTASTVTANTTIVIQDINDIQPRFDSRQYSARVTENSPAGVLVLNVSAVDNDYGLDSNGNSNGNNILSFSFSAVNSPPANTFSINRETGAITTLRPLDREQATRYVFTVVVQDNPVVGLVRVDTATVTIDIEDINEFPPRADPDNYLAFISELLGTGEQIPTYAQAAWNIQCEY